MIPKSYSQIARIMSILSASTDPPGVSIENLQELLGLEGIMGYQKVLSLLNILERYLRPIGLKLKFDPNYRVWYIQHIQPPDDVVSLNLPARLAATLMYVLILTHDTGNAVEIDKIAQHRKKSKRGVYDDLRELEKMKLVKIDGDSVRPSKYLPFIIDIDKFFSKLAMLMMSQEEK